MKLNYLDKELILSRVIESTSGCWEWQGLLLANGYGQVMINYKKYLVHRLAKFLWHGFNLRSAKIICHTYDYRRCCNPDHLFIGTRRDNYYDSMSKGRNCFGSRHGCALLDEDDVYLIRALPKDWPHTIIAPIFNVSDITIGDIRRRKTWLHV